MPRAKKLLPSTLSIQLSMVSFSCQAFDFDELCQTIERRLCELGQLEPKQFPMTHREVVRSGKRVGLYFCVHGPRNVKLTAICDFAMNMVIYYGSDGIRKDREKLHLRSPMLSAA